MTTPYGYIHVYGILQDNHAKFNQYAVGACCVLCGAGAEIHTHFIADCPRLGCIRGLFSQIVYSHLVYSHFVYCPILSTPILSTFPFRLFPFGLFSLLCSQSLIYIRKRSFPPQMFPLKPVLLVHRYVIIRLIVLGFNNTSILMGHFVLSPREREKLDLEETVEEMKDRN